MKIERICETCGSKITVDRFCKRIDGMCSNIEETGDDWDFIDWCEFPCPRKDGPLLSKAQKASKDAAIKQENDRLDKLRKKYGKRCPHPLEERAYIGYEYCYGPRYFYQCKICGHRSTKYTEITQSHLGD